MTSVPLLLTVLGRTAARQGRRRGQLEVLAVSGPGKARWLPLSLLYCTWMVSVPTPSPRERLSDEHPAPAQVVEVLVSGWPWVQMSGI